MLPKVAGELFQYYIDGKERIIRYSRRSTDFLVKSNSVKAKGNAGTEWRQAAKRTTKAEGRG